MKKSVLETFNKLFYCSIILTIAWSCGLDNFSNNSEITTLTKIHSDQEEAIFFMINKNNDITNRVNAMYATLRATGASSKEISRVKEILNTVEATNELTRSIHNDLAKRTLLILISSIDATTNMEEFEDIEEAILSGDYEAQTKLNVLNEKINQLGINQSYGNGMDENSSNNLFHINEDGYIFIKNLSDYLNKNDYDTPTRLLAGESFEQIAPEGHHLMDNLHHYRNQTLGLIANHKGMNSYGNQIVYKMDASFIESPDFLENYDDIFNFQITVDSALQSMISNGQIDPGDKDILNELYMKTTLPLYSMKYGEMYPWIFAQFENSIIGSSAILTSLRRDILQTQNLVLTHLLSKIRVQSFSFNKIEPLVYSSSSYINQGESLGLKVVIAAYDSTEKMNLRYWVDDTSKKGTPLTFKGNAGDELKLSGSVGEHTIVGEIAVKEKGVVKWKPWTFKYTVGGSNTSVSSNYSKENSKTATKAKIIAHFGGKSSGTIKKIDACSIPSLKAKITNGSSTISCQVLGFQLLVNKNGKPNKINAKGERLSNIQKALIKQASKGSDITFTKIKVRNTKGDVITIENDLVLKLN